MNSAPRGNNIPTLTEIISIEKEAEAISIAKKEAPAQTQTKPQPKQTQADLIPEPSYEELEKELNEKVLRQLMMRVDFVLEHRVRDGLAEVLQNATDSLAKEIRQGLVKSLAELIDRTISQEISKIQSSKSQK